HPAVHPADDGVGDEQNAPAQLHVRLRLSLDPQAVLRHEPLQVAVGTVAEVGDFQPVGQDVIAVVAHQRVAVENHGADAADDHEAEAQVVDERLAGAVPPDEGGDGGNHQLDVDAGARDDDALPFVGQGPGVGDVAIHGRRQAQYQKAHLVHFAAE